MVKLNKQATLAIFAVAFAAAMIVGSIAASADNMAFATHGKKTAQKMKQSNSNSQGTTCDSNGGFASGTGSSGLGIGAGIGLGGNGFLNLCPNFNTNTNAATGNQGASS